MLSFSHPDLLALNEPFGLSRRLLTQREFIGTEKCLKEEVSCTHISALSAGLWETAGVLLACGKKTHQKIEKLGHLDSFASSFQLGFCCCSDWHIWAHTDCAAAGSYGILHACCPCSQLVHTLGCLEGPGQGQGCVELAVSSYEQQGCLCLSEGPCKVLQAKAQARKGMYPSSSSVVVTERKAICVCTHLPGLFCLSPYSSSATYSSIPFFLDSTTASPVQAIFLPLSQNPSEKSARPFLGQVLIWWVCLNSV